MIDSEKTQFSPNESQKTKNSSNQNIRLNINLNPVEEDDKYSNADEQQEHSSEDENLGYNSNYTLDKKNMVNKDIQNFEEISLKSITRDSTSISQSEINLEQISSSTPLNLKRENNDRKASFTPFTIINYSRERINSTPITNYFQGMDYYLRGKEPERSDYTKTGNFIKKEEFFQDRDLTFKAMKYKSFDMSDPFRFCSNKTLKRNDDTNKLNANNNINNFPQNKITQINIENKIQNSTINNINIINNQPMIMQMPQNFENGTGKFDMPMYYVRYCDFDCKFL